MTKYCVDADTELSRRKRFHLVFDGTPECVYATRSLSELLHWCADGDIKEIEVKTETETYKLTIEIPEVE